MTNTHELKDKAILIGWAVGLLFFTSLLWILTQPAQAHYLLRTVNNVFINNNDSRRVSNYLPQKTGKAGLLGYWYSMINSEKRMFVFGVFRDGALIPAGAVVSANGEVEELIPLSAHAVQVFDALPESILQLYVTRIEGDAK
jgi:hypothetical protein